MNILLSPWHSEIQLLAAALQLAPGPDSASLSREERGLVDLAAASEWVVPEEILGQIRECIRLGGDPLGDGLLAVRSGASRRRLGQIFTPPALVGPMVDWVASEDPGRIIDAGAGTGRFACALAQAVPHAEIHAIEADPLVALLLRANLAVLGARNVTVHVADYTQLDLPGIDRKTAFIGNPPYVRHHELSPAAKTWARGAAARIGVSISGLAGLHAYFFLATAALGRPGDVGCFVTSAEWMDVNYGQVVRDLLLDGLGGEAVHLLDPTATPFEDVATTAAVTCFRVASQPRSIKFRRVGELPQLSPLSGGRRVSRARLQETRRWTQLTRAATDIPDGYVELGELCRVHRGAVTGSNQTWVMQARDCGELPSSVLFPSVTRARELFDAGMSLSTTEHLRRVVDLPEDLDELDADELRTVERFLRRAEARGAAGGYIARHRRAWWSVGLRAPAPILATYMARRPPAFVRNPVGAHHINIAHGLYPREPLPEAALDRLAEALRTEIGLHQGRTYAGGLTKFEPREMERLPVPDLPLLLRE